MSISLAKLQQLKRQSGQRLGPGSFTPTLPAEARPHQEASTVHPSSSHQPQTDAEASLDRLRTLLRARKPRVERVDGHHDRDVPGKEIATGLRLVERIQTCDATPEWLDGTFDRKDALRARDLLFFDTETTGLAGGTGTRAFMIGAADWVDAGLRVRQLYLTAMAGEAAMLEAFATWLRPTTTLVSYNGKCYDAPLLATRYRLARRPNPLAALQHVDLLFPSRRRWRGVWENCRLATIEREVLRVVREDDLPGAEAPAAWLEYLRGGSASKLRRVAAHNHQDVVSLSRLVGVLAQPVQDGV